MPEITSGVHPEKGLHGKQPSRSNFSDRLAQLETAIRNGQADYFIIGSSLTVIQGERLYKTTYNTFEEYCEKRWGFTRQAAYDYIRARIVAENVKLTLQNPPSFTQAVELSRLTPEQQQAAANRLDFETATVKDVKTVVDKMLGKLPAPTPTEPKEITIEAALEALVTKIVMQPYGYYAAKFSKYSFQHTTDLVVVEKAKLEVYQQILRVCEGKLA